MESSFANESTEFGSFKRKLKTNSKKCPAKCLDLKVKLEKEEIDKSGDNDVVRQDLATVKSKGDEDSPSSDSTSSDYDSDWSKADKNKHECKDCKDDGVLLRTYSSKKRLQAHIKRVHQSVDDCKFICRECSVPSPHRTKAKYMYHLGTKHPGIVQFVCEFCATIFKFKANYKDHLTTHNVVPKKEFTCDVCRGTFVNKAGYEAHQRRFPGPHIKLICVHCGFSFSREKQMKNHRCKKLLLEEAAKEAAKLQIKTIEEDIPPDPAPVEPYRAITIAESVESVVVEELLRSEDSGQIIIRDLSGQIVPNSQVLRFDIVEDGESSEQVYQVNVADWNMVAPYIIRDPSAQSEAAALVE